MKKNKRKTRKVIYEIYDYCYMVKICKEKQKNTKDTYEVLNDRNLQTKQIKKHVAHFHLTNYNVCGFSYVL